jgi:hypothetical protein
MAEEVVANDSHQGANRLLSAHARGMTSPARLANRVT